MCWLNLRLFDFYKKNITIESQTLTSWKIIYSTKWLSLNELQNHYLGWNLIHKYICTYNFLTINPCFPWQTRPVYSLSLSPLHYLFIYLIHFSFCEKNARTFYINQSTKWKSTSHLQSNNHHHYHQTNTCSLNSR